MAGVADLVLLIGVYLSAYGLSPVLLGFPVGLAIAGILVPRLAAPRLAKLEGMLQKWQAFSDDGDEDGEL